MGVSSREVICVCRVDEGPILGCGVISLRDNFFAARNFVAREFCVRHVGGNPDLSRV